MTPETLAVLITRREARLPAVLATRLSDGAQWVLPDESADAALWEAARVAFAGGRSTKTLVGDEPFFLDLHLPAPRLLLVGAVHIAQLLAPMAAAFGIEPIVIDPRESFATADRFPGVTLRVAWPDEAMPGEAADGATAVVVLSHDPKIDDPALLSALRTDAFYVGALGSARTHAARLVRLREAGVEEADLGRIRGPVGLAIGAVTTAEIALSILAEIVAVRRAGKLASRA